jgi:hypothetical protein
MSVCSTVRTLAAIASCEDEEKEKNHVRLEAVMVVHFNAPC